MENKLILFYRRFKQHPKEKYWANLEKFKLIIQDFAAEYNEPEIIDLAIKTHELLCIDYVRKFC